MSVSQSVFTAWLKDSNAVRCVLVEVDVKLSGGSTVTRYLSNTGYVTGASDTPANTGYTSCISGGVKFTESISLDGSFSLSYGDIELRNVNGELDTWLNDYWANRRIKVFIGDKSWVRDDFWQIFDGVTTGIDTRKRETINIKLSDKLQRLNSPMTDHKLGGLTVNADKLIPLCFGECHNVEPLLVDPTTSEYQVHDGAIESIIEVRDNGVPVSFTPYLSTGKFRLLSAPAGLVTASVQGYLAPLSVYPTDIASLILHITTNYGTVANRFVPGDYDAASLFAFSAANPQPVGIYINERMNVLDVCNKLASSVGGRVVMSRTGLLTLVKLALPQATSGTTVTAANMTDRSLHIASMPSVKAGVMLGYDKNWTVQNTVALGVTAIHADMFREEWLSVTSTDSTTAANYNLYTEPTLEETNLLVSADAVTEAVRRLNLWKTQRKVVGYRGYGDLMLEALGNPQTIQHSRFGLGAGVTGQIVGVTTDWLNQKVDLEVLI